MYHRVIDCAVDPWGLAVSPTNFRAQVEQLRRERTLLGMAEFVARAADRRLPRDAIAITFDDGYYDNLDQAAQVLAEIDAPATLFLATGPMCDGFYWWDELAAMVLDAGPVTAELAIAGRRVVIDLPDREQADYNRQGWRAWEPPRTKREALFYSLWSDIRPLPRMQARAALAQVAAIMPGRTPDEDRAMTVDDVTRLLSSAPVSLGGHTVDHADLVALSESEALAQITEGKRTIEAMWGRITGFAYPYGRHDAAVMRLAAQAGFLYACTTVGAAVGRGNDPLSLPRVAAQDTPDLRWLPH